MSSSNTDNRPLSPHISIYRPQVTSVLSILHRITGIGLGVSLLFIVWWFFAAASSAEYFNFVSSILLSPPLKFIFLISIWAIWYHTLTGLRHLIWDAGFGFEMSWVKVSAWVIVGASFLFTALTLFIQGDW